MTPKPPSDLSFFAGDANAITEPTIKGARIPIRDLDSGSMASVVGEDRDLPPA